MRYPFLICRIDEVSKRVDSGTVVNRIDELSKMINNLTETIGGINDNLTKIGAINDNLTQKITETNEKIAWCRRYIVIQCNCQYCVEDFLWQVLAVMIECRSKSHAPFIGIVVLEIGRTVAGISIAKCICIASYD